MLINKKMMLASKRKPTIVFVLGVFFSLLAGCGSEGSSEGNTTVAFQELSPTNEQTTLPITTAYNLPDEITPDVAVAEMEIGINLGNTLDAPNEGDWALPAQESFIVAFKEAGFKHIRIPVTWHEHTESLPPYDIDNDFLIRVEEVVDWALAQDLYVIINAHHESWLKENYQDQENRDRFDNIWIQIASHFKEKPAKLIFELLNEPNGMTVEDVNGMNKRVLAIIRNENPNRLAIFSGNAFTPVDSLLATEIPNTEDQFLIGNFHSYDPWGFAGQCQQNWGSDEDKASLRHIYQQASDWSVVNQIPVMVNEFGAAKYDFTLPDNICDLSERLEYLTHHITLADEFGIAGSYWDDGGSFSTFDRTNNTFGPEKDILVSENNSR